MRRLIILDYLDWLLKQILFGIYSFSSDCWSLLWAERWAIINGLGCIESKAKKRNWIREKKCWKNHKNLRETSFTAINSSNCELVSCWGSSDLLAWSDPCSDGSISFYSCGYDFRRNSASSALHWTKAISNRLHECTRYHVN